MNFNNKTPWLRLAPGPNLKYLLNFVTTKPYVVLMPLLSMDKLLLSFKSLRAWVLITALFFGGAELHKATLSKLSDAVRNASVQMAYADNTDSVAQYEAFNWLAIYNDLAHRGPAYWNYLWSGRAAELTDKVDDDGVKGWFYLDPGEKAATNLSNWNFNGVHAIADLLVFSMDARPTSELISPGAWHAGNEPASGADSPDGILLRIRRVYQRYSEYVAGLNQSPPRRSQYIQSLLKSHQLFISVEDQVRFEERNRQRALRTTVRKPSASRTLQQPTRTSAARLAHIHSAGDVMRRVRDHQTVIFWPLPGTHIAMIEAPRFIQLPPSFITLHGGAELRRLFDKNAQPIAIKDLSGSEGWLVATRGGRTGFITSSAYTYFTEDVETPLPQDPQYEFADAPVIATEALQLYVLTSDQKALVMQHRDVTDRDKPVTQLAAGTRLARILNDSHSPSSGGIGDGTYGWLVRVDQFNLVGLVRQSQYKSSTRPAAVW